MPPAATSTPAVPPTPAIPTVFTIRRKVFKLFGGAFTVLDESGATIAYCKQKSFKLKEDLRVWTGEDATAEIIRIQARQAIDFGATYDVLAPDGARLGGFRRKGFTSMMRDSWVILGEEDREIGEIKEDSLAMALVRRFLINIFPQKFVCTLGMGGRAAMTQNFNPFVQKLRVDLSAWPSMYDRRLALAMGIIVHAIEGRQQ